MNDRDILLDIQGLVKVYDTGRRAIDDLSLQVQRGSLFGFIGLNGAGKTTTIRILAGLTQRTAGAIRLFGKPFDPRDQQLKRSMGFVLDEPLYFDWMDARSYLRFVGAMYGLEIREAERRATELLEFFDLAGKGEDPIETFSTGMKKKISLAAAVIHTPKMIFLDEPLEGIDALAARSIKETLSMMAAGGTTMFITSHVLDTVERLCSDVAIVHHGAVVLQCRTDEIRTRAKRALPHETYASLEELFVDLVSDAAPAKRLSFL